MDTFRTLFSGRGLGWGYGGVINLGLWGIGGDSGLTNSSGHILTIFWISSKLSNFGRLVSLPIV